MTDTKRTWIGVDVGGTFTDIAVCAGADEPLRLHKVLSTPDAPERAISSGIEAALRDCPAHTVERLAHGTTVGTNALIERRIGRVALVTTEGFRDLLEIGRQTRPKVYDIHHDYPSPLVPRRLRFEVRERVGADGTVHMPLHQGDIEEAAQGIAREAVDAVVVCFLNSYAWPRHEFATAARLRELLPASVYVAASSELFPEFREYERFSTAVLNAALVTVMSGYLARFGRRMNEIGVAAEPVISQSAGGLMSLSEARRVPIRASLSGPAAGVIGAAARAIAAGYREVITIDVGGTSADVSLLADGQPAEVHSRTLAGFPLRLSTIDVNAVGAGGGSIAFVDRDGLLKVGPRSVGSVPGPACYGLGGTLATVTDANVLLGRLNPDALLDGAMPIRKDLSAQAVGRIAAELGLDTMTTALGIVRVACGLMVNAIRSISVERGHDPSHFALFPYGGAGPLHATEIARALEMRLVIVPPNPGILCAEGLLHCDLRGDRVRTAVTPLHADHAASIQDELRALSGAACAWFEQENVALENRLVLCFADLRYRGQNFEISIPMEAVDLDLSGIDLLAERFHAAHDRAYGFAFRSETIELVNLRVQMRGLLPKPIVGKIPARGGAVVVAHREVVFKEGAVAATPVWQRRDLGAGQHIEGPAVIEQLDSTTVIAPGDRAEIDDWGNIVIHLRSES